MHKPIKYVEKGLTYAAKGAWVVFDALNRIKPNASFTPKWSDKPLLKSHQKVKPPLGWPRETDSLCPTCVREARQEILDGKRDYKVLLTEKIGHRIVGRRTYRGRDDSSASRCVQRRGADVRRSIGHGRSMACKARCGVRRQDAARAERLESAGDQHSR